MNGLKTRGTRITLESSSAPKWSSMNTGLCVITGFATGSARSHSPRSPYGAEPRSVGIASAQHACHHAAALAFLRYRGHPRNSRRPQTAGGVRAVLQHLPRRRAGALDPIHRHETTTRPASLGMQAAAATMPAPQERSAFAHRAADLDRLAMRPAAVTSAHRERTSILGRARHASPRASAINSAIEF